MSSLPAHRFAVGSAVNQTARQIGDAFGIAVLVALIGSQRDLADPVDGFHQLWAFGAATALFSGAIGSLIPRVDERTVAIADELVVTDADVLLLPVETS